MAAIHDPDIGADIASKIDAFVASKMIMKMSRSSVYKGIADRSDNRLHHRLTAVAPTFFSSVPV